MAAASTVRFAELVKRGGKPEVHLSWVAPAKDRELQRAQKQHRLVTVHQHARGPRDFGVVGFEAAPDAQFLVFPKSLRAFAGRKVVGIKYELVEGASAEKTTSPAREKIRAKKAAFSEKTAPSRRPSRSGRRPARGKVAAEPEPESEPQPEVEFVTESDPVKREVRKALIALSAGRTAEAKRRLQGILAGDES